VTSTTDTAGHPDVAEISDLTEGLLPPSRTADIRRHLDECELCADVYASLEEIPGLLGTLPGPSRMPADIAGRIDAALAAEALLSASAPQSVNSPTLVSASRSVSGEDAEAHVSRETSTVTHRPAGRSHSATGPGRKDRKRGGRRRTVVLGAVFTAAVLGAGSLFLQSLGDHKSSNTTAQGKQTSSADTFAKGQLESQVTDLLTTKKTSGRGSGSEKPWNLASEPDGSGSKTPKTMIQPSTSIPDCIRKGINRGNDDVLGAKQGTYNGTAAYLVVLTDTSDTTRVMAYVVDSACVSGQTSTPGKVLLKQSYAHP
jgi:anti-sigma factor RsiW